MQRFDPTKQQIEDHQNKAVEGQNSNTNSLNGMSNAKIRTITTLMMVFGFAFLIMMGHFYCTLLVITIEILIFKEILGLKRNRESENKIPLFRVVNWYFFSTALFFIYGKIFNDKFKYLIDNNRVVAFAFQYHTMISFILYIIGFLIFVLSLKKGQYKYQFKLFGWSHLVLVLMIGASSTYVINIYKGFIWFAFPAFLVIANDIFAYIFGKNFGKHPLIKLSPKKTWEGFIGGFFSTCIVAWLFSEIFTRIDFLICPQDQINIEPFTYEHCEMPQLFVREPYEAPAFLSYIGISTIYISQFQIHSIIFTAFASFIAPFGGFFASGFKRAFKIKDFGDTIPGTSIIILSTVGHGGVTDRFDCQLLMGVFVCIYYNQIIFQLSNSVDMMLKEILKLPYAEQMELYLYLGKALNITT